MNPERITEMLNELRVLPFFPNDEYTILALVRLVGAMAKTEDQVAWLVARMTSGIYRKWPGPLEMRACFCGKYPPKDGINAYSEVYPDGIPSERDHRLAIGSAEMKALPLGDEVSGFADKRAEAALGIAAGIMDLKSQSLRGRATKEEIAAAPEWLRRLEGYE